MQCQFIKADKSSVLGTGGNHICTYYRVPLLCTCMRHWRVKFFYHRIARRADSVNLLSFATLAATVAFAPPLIDPKVCT